jgi:predicted HicB family RNase H-like nuclease
MRKARFQKQLTIAIPPEHFEQIKKITDDRQISIAEWVRDAVDVALKTNQRKEVKFIEGSDR